MKRLFPIILIKLYFLIQVFLVSCIPTVLATNTILGGNSTADQYVQQHTKSTTGFIENKGQFVNDKGDAIPNVLFKTSFRGVDMYITTKGITYVFLRIEEGDDQQYDRYEYETASLVSRERDEGRKINWCRLDMDIVGSNILKENIITEQPSKQGVTNYYLAHCPEGILNVKPYQKLTIKSVYPGVDWIIYADDEQGLKYDFVVSPGADPDAIKLLYSGAENIIITGDGRFLTIKTSFGEIKEGEIVCYEESDGKKINSKYLVNDNKISFDIGNYDKSKTLIIDPPLELVWATYYGGSSFDIGYGITNDELGNIFIVGISTSTNFPLLNPGGGAYYQGSYQGDDEIIILKFDNSGQRLWATHYGGSDEDIGTDIISDQSGNVFVTGYTRSVDLPTYNPGGGSYYQDSLAYISSLMSDAIILEFSNTGQRLWATYYGGWGNEQGHSIEVDQTGNIFITGFTGSNDFPVLNPGGGTYFQVPPIGGTSVFILKFNNSGIRLWATTYGGSGMEYGVSITTDHFNNVFITGRTISSNFPIQDPGGGAYFQDYIAGGFDAFILKFNNSGVRLWATYYGGSGSDRGISMTTDGSGNIFITGRTESIDFPVYDPGGNAYYQGYNAGMQDLYILKFDNVCNRQWATYFGGNYSELNIYTDHLNDLISVDKSGNIFLCYGTSSSTIPTLQPSTCSYFENQLTDTTDIFIIEFTPDLALHWSTYYHGSSDEQGCGITTDTSGCIFIIGYLTENSVIDVLDPDSGAYFQPVSAGYSEIGIMKFCPCCPSLISLTNSSDVTVCVGDSTAFQITAISADSISYQWYHNGMAINGSNDSVCIIDPVSQSDTGFYYCQLTNNCETKLSDSVRLDIGPNFVDTIHLAICAGDSVFAGGGYQKFAGTYFDSYPCITFCDSIIITVLTINNIYYYQNVFNICNGDSIFAGGQYLKFPGVYFDSLTTTLGCDSVTVTVLIVDYGTVIQVDTSICNGDSIYAAGEYRKQPGIYIDTLLSVFACDSIAITNISFYQIPTVFLGNDTTINFGDSLILDAGSGFVSCLWSDGSSCNTLTVTNPGVYWCTGTNICGDEATDTITISIGYSINGSLSYANTVMTEMNNTKIYLKQLPDNIIDSTITDNTGNFTFNALGASTYFLEPKITKPWGGSNSTDALAIMKHFVGMTYLNGIYLTAADVDATGYVNTSDALMIQRRYVGMISNYFSDDWTWERDNIVVYGQSVNYDFNALCYGDVNGSYIPSQTKQIPGITLIPAMEMSIEPYQSFEMPLLVEKPMEVGAVSLEIDYPSEYLNITGIRLGNGEEDNLVYTDSDGEIRISWYNTRPLQLKEYDTILIIKIKAGDIQGIGSDKMQFIANGSSELADGDVEVIEDVNILFPQLKVEYSPVEYYLTQNFPNPFNDRTKIGYGLKNDGYVKLKVFNVLGGVISEPVSSYQTAGHHDVIFDGSDLPEGVYFYRVEIRDKKGAFYQTQKMVIAN